MNMVDEIDLGLVEAARGDRLTFSQVEETLPEGLECKDISCEEYREYRVHGEWLRVHGIALVTRPGGSTHRVVAADGTVTCVPKDCALRWKDHDINVPVKF